MIASAAAATIEVTVVGMTAVAASAASAGIDLVGDVINAADVQATIVVIS